MPPQSGHSCPQRIGAALPHAKATPPAYLPEPDSKPASRPPGPSVIPPFPARVCAVSHLPFPHSTDPGPRQREPRTTDGAENPTSPSVESGTSDLHGESAEPGLQRDGTQAAMSVPVPGSLSNSNSAREACPLAHAPRVHVEECFGAGTGRPSKWANQSDRRDLRVCAQEHRDRDSGHRRRPAPVPFDGVRGTNDVRIFEN